jgi:hypothetical protein
MIRIVVHDKQWFIDRIGKRIYREKNICDCSVCRKVHEKGLIIADEKHAIYLYDCQEMDLIYYDKKEITNE